MAGYDIFFTGFEGGKRDWPSQQSNTLFVDDGLAVTGEYCLHAFLGVAGTADGVITGPTPSAGRAITSSFATGKTRVKFRLKQNVSADHVMIMGYCTYQDADVGGVMKVKINRTFCASAYGTNGTYSTAVLALETDYIAEETMILTDSGANSSCSVSVSVYTIAGVLIETVTASASGLPDNPDFPEPSLGHHDAISSTYWVVFDDWYSQVVDAATPVFPNGTRITRVDATSMSGTIGIGAWTGVYQNIINIPFGESTVGAITSSTLDSKVNFSHKTAIQLGLNEIAGLNLYTHVKAGAAGNEYILINSNITVTAVLTTYDTYPYLVQLMSSLTNPDFNSLTFGLQNARSQLVTVAQQYMEVLHGGDNLPRELTGEDSWKHKIVQFVASGGFGEVTDVNFESQVILVKKYSGTDEAGFLKLRINGGTQSRVINATTVDPLGIMYVTSNGFTYGPSLEAGQTYVALCIQDGGVGENCKFMRYGAFVAAPSLGTTITIKTAWEPDFVGVQGDDIFVYATDTETVGDSVPLNNSATVTGYIATLTSSGFTVGTNLDNGRVYYYFAIRMLTGLNAFFNYNKFTAAGASHTVTGLLFQPAFAIGKRIAAIIAQWRSALVHSATDSSIWDTVVTNTTGITAFTVDGLSFGSSLSNAGDVTKWLAFKDEGEITIGSLTPTADAGPDQAVTEYEADLNGTAGAGNYPCASLTYLWELQSGPSGSVIASPTAIDTAVTFIQSGVYVFILSVNNGAEIATDTVQITVSCGRPVSVSAGPDQIVLLGTVVQLDGTVVE